ncbi:YjeF N-terminal domain-containing protein [Xylariales sp. PMI_506]|nr:YjeF N-terminal domain-containing protein [Xylariales sp. PMI_506]
MEFVGMHMTVVLRDPPGCTIEGTVLNIIPSKLLTLGNAYVLSTGERFPQLALNADNIQDIKHNVDQPPAPSFAAPVQEPTNTVPAYTQPPSNSNFQDPAIMSIGRRPGPSSRTNSTAGERFGPAPTTSAPAPVTRKPTQILTGPVTDDFNSLNLGGRDGTDKLKSAQVDVATLDTTEDETARTPTGPSVQSASNKATKRPRQRQRKSRNGRQDGNSTPTSNARPTEQGDGWRQTPILQSNKSFQPFSSLKRSQKNRNAVNLDGWASEDPTDVQEAGDFDFEESLSKFDKRAVFEELSMQDEIDEADRLVSHNRLPRPKPGTAGGKNLHYSENVLDMPSTTSKLKETPDDFWKSEADDATINGGERLSGREGSGRNSRLRGDSRLSTTRRSQSRKASATQATIGGPSRVNTVNTSQPVIGTEAQGLYSTRFNRRIETVTYLQMLNIENISHSELGFSEDLIAENAGRGIAEVAFTALDDPAVTLRNATASLPSTATIVVLAGNNKSGSRAIAAGRHLRNHGTNVLVCVVGIERERELIDEVRRQIRLFRSFGGVVCSKTQLFENLSKSAMTLDSSTQISVTLILEALLGLAISFEELRKSDQATTYELMEWANRNEAFIVSVDIPSGIDPTSGKVNIIDGAKLYVQPRYIVALGAPKQGLLKALELSQDQRDDIAAEEWKLYLADLGLSTTIWRKAATKLRRGIEYDDKWILEMRYQPHPEEAE